MTRDGRSVATLYRGDGFGEIALLADVPRTATCTTDTASLLYGLEKEPFLAAVTGHRRSSEAARLQVGRRLGGLQGAG